MHDPRGTFAPSDDHRVPLGPLSRTMKSVLRGLLRGEPELPKHSFSALERRGLLEGNVLTPIGRTIAIGLLPLREQAEILGVPLRTTRTHAGEPPELAVRRQQVEAGGTSSFCEGGSLRTLIYACCFPRLYNFAHAKFGGEEGARSYMYTSILVYRWLLPEHPDLPERMLHDVGNAREGEVLDSFDRLRSWQWGDTWAFRSWVGVEREHVRALFRALRGDALMALAAGFLSDAVFFAKGWPDLVTVRDGTVIASEVKTTDRLHHSQIYTIGSLLLPARVPVEVVQARAG